MKKIDMTGWVMKEHGVENSKWTVLSKGTTKNRQTHWLCQCECGNIKEVQGGHLRDGSSTSCGCKNRERIIELNHDKYIPIPIGTRFGLLTVIENCGTELEYPNVYHGVSLCQCDCGSTPKKYFNYRLKRGTIKSCGCLKSWGETYISKILESHNIEYQREYSFEDCKNDNCYKYRFDFAIFNQGKLEYLIEFDGKQHTVGGKENWGGTLEEIQYSDTNKNKYCLEHNIILKRIPYYELENLSLDLIQSDKYNVTAHNCYPVLIDDIITAMEKKMEEKK